MSHGRLKGRRIAVTGGHGAIGTALVRRLLAENVASLTVLDTRRSDGLDPRVRQVTGSILESDRVADAIAGCDAVVHLAAMTVVSVCAADPMACFDVNVTGTVGVLEACRQAEVAHVVFASTAHVYGRPERQPVDETHPVRPASSYACSKAAAELAVQAWAASGFSGSILRYGNVYGPGTSREAVLGQACHQVATEGTVRVRSLAPIRDFLFVEDAAEALVRVLAMGPPPAGIETLNVSSGKGEAVGRAIGLLLEVAETLSGRRPSIVETDPAAAEPVPSLVLDVAALTRRVGWRPTTDLAEGLRATIGHELALTR